MLLFINAQGLNIHIRRALYQENLIMLKHFKHFCGDESGATAIEYGLIAALVSVAAIGALTTMGTSLQTMFSTVSNSMSAAVNGG